jgi:hypothetical protein
MSARVSQFSRGGSTTTVVGEITRELVNASDGQGLHFDGAAGNIDIASPPDLGTKFSFEFIVQADSFGSATSWLIDFGIAGRFVFGSDGSTSYNLGVYDNTSWKSLGVKVLDDLKVHHLVATIDGASVVLYDNGNQVGTATISASHGIDNCTDARIASSYTGGSEWFNGTIYRARLWNKTLTAAEVTASYENATVPFADQYGSQTEMMANNNFSSGDTGWNKNAGWTIVDQGGGDYEGVATSVINGNVLYQQPAALTAGKKYRLTYTVTAISAGGFNWRSGSTNDIATTRTTVGTYTEELTITDVDGDILGIEAVGTTTGRIDDVSVVEIGCVSDYDLAFANPTQSLMVQDRAGAADGTSSATGVAQVTPIEQLNAKALSIGTTAATPADGELYVSGPTITLDSAANASVVIDKASVSKRANVRYKTAGADNWFAGLPDADQITGGNQYFIGQSETGENAAIMIEHGAGGSSGTVGSMRINSAGNVGFQTTPKAWGSVYPAIQVGESAALVGRSSTNQCRLGNNWYADAVGDKRINSGLASQYIQTSLGHHEFFTAATGAADSVITFGPAKLTIANTGLATFANGINLGDENLDTYDEGTWTPVISDGTNNATASTAYGSYVKVGKLVMITCDIILSSLGSMSGALQLSALPFTTSTTANSYASLTCGYASGLSITAGNVVSANTDSNKTYAYLRLWNTSSGVNSLDATHLTATSRFMISGSYPANA